MKKKYVFFIVLSLTVIVIFLFLGGPEYYDKKIPNFKGEIELYIYPDTSPEEVREMILSSGK